MALAARATARVQLPDPDIATAARELDDAVERLHRLGNGWGEAITRVSLGRVAWLRGARDDALAQFERASELADAGGDLFTRSVGGQSDRAPAAGRRQGRRGRGRCSAARCWTR